MVLDQLAGSREGLYIVVVGAARDLAEALVREPGLFAEKCRGIYLNIRSGSPDPAAVKAVEWNVKLDPAGFAEIFKAPCPVFWMPCLQDEAGAGDADSREFATHYRFRQDEILNELPPRVRNYFGWMFSKESSSAWLEALNGNFDQLLAAKGPEYRMMYSTGSFFDLAGFGVTRNGKILPKGDASGDWVYRFDPIEVECTAEGGARWQPSVSPSCQRFIFHVLDPVSYPKAMATAMRELLVSAYAPETLAKV